ncbi:Ycf66 family protein [Leptolyngbya sp. FACHB-541]|uniref:Ycf66 family protein n=1 Tax=Leptolyngbya sp. FACHB-541 TaxID=2692810 RepID=UPI0016852728|nr:Ycf66 family protein [Leptolyngbya sp. FACHB-541]MBD2000920.1 Ycf66 family protein [Leptolyngbya sp. FACHB-541]
MLAHILALTIGFGSFGLYMSAFFFPEVHRKNDFTWSGVGLFYALVLWVCAGRITGGVLLGQTASVALLGWLGWQTLALRRALTPRDQQTQLPGSAKSLGEAFQNGWKQLQTTLPQRLQRLPLLNGLVQPIAGLFSGLFAATATFIQNLLKPKPKPKRSPKNRPAKSRAAQPASPTEGSEAEAEVILEATIAEPSGAADLDEFDELDELDKFIESVDATTKPATPKPTPPAEVSEAIAPETSEALLESPIEEVPSVATPTAESPASENLGESGSPGESGELEDLDGAIASHNNSPS